MMAWILNLGMTGQTYEFDTPGLEATLPENRFHFSVGTNRFEFTLSDS